MKINGEIAEAEQKKISEMFPSTDLLINGSVYNRGNNGWNRVIDVIPQSVLKMKKIGLLEFWGGFIETESSFPEALKNIEIHNLSLAYPISDYSIEKLRKLLPKTKLFIDGKRIQ